MLTNFNSSLTKKKLLIILKVKEILGIQNGLCGFYWYRFVDRHLMSFTTLFFFFACKKVNRMFNQGH